MQKKKKEVDAKIKSILTQIDDQFVILIQRKTNNRTSYEIKERFHFDSQHITLVSWEQQQTNKNQLQGLNPAFSFSYPRYKKTEIPQ